MSIAGPETPASRQSRAAFGP